MDKTLSAHTTFVKAVDQLRNTECSDKQKINLFKEIQESITSPALGSYVNFSRHCGSAVSVLLLFSEDLDHNVRIKAEENLYKIIRHLEKHRLNRLLMDLYGEIKKNGNQRSLKICLQVFANFLPKIKEKNIKWYSVKLIPCLQVISQRTEAMVIDCFNIFFAKFSKYIHISSPNENGVNFLLETFLQNLTSSIPSQRRSSAQNAMVLIQCSRHKLAFAKKSLSISIEILLTEKDSQDMILGIFGFFKLLLPVLLEDPGFKDFRSIIEIYELALYYLETSNLKADHAIINVSLDVINCVIKCASSTNKTLMNILFNDVKCRERQEFSDKRKSLKNRIILHEHKEDFEEGSDQTKSKYNQSDDKSLILSDLENESFNSIDFDSMKLCPEQSIEGTIDELSQEFPDTIRSTRTVFHNLLVSAESEPIQKPNLPETPRKSPRKSPSIKQNPFLTPKRTHNLPIGSLYSQSMLLYTVRLVAGRFLLSGVKSQLKSDEISRISIKNLSLETIASCVRLNPKVLHILLQVDEGCNTILIPSEEEECQDQNSVTGRDYSPPKTHQNEELTKADDFKEDEGEEKLLDIKFDHFGDEDESASGYFYDFNLESMSTSSAGTEMRKSAENSSKGITVEEVKGTKGRTKMATAGAGPREKEENNGNFENPLELPILSDLTGIDKQNLFDVLLYWSHCDPMLRGHVQIIVGYYFMGDSSSVHWEIADYLIGILIKGLKDENHHVVIQSLTAFNMIFPIMLSKYLVSSEKSHSHFVCRQPTIPQQHRDRPDSNQIDDDDDDAYDEREDEFDDSLLNTTMDNNLSNTLNRNRQASEGGGGGVEVGDGTGQTGCRVSPKYLLNKALRCWNNKYWLVQNKYAETISNLDGFLLSSAFGEEFQHWLMNNLLNELITLISVDDSRIRENAAKCITNFINNFNLRGSSAGCGSGRGNDDVATGNILVAPSDDDGGYMKQKLVQLFVCEKVVDGLSKYLRELFSVKTGKQRSVHEISPMLAKVFYILTNKLLDFHKKSEHLGMIYTLNIMIVEFHPILYHNVYEEFKLVEIFLNICRNNYEMANDINVQILCLKNLSFLVGANILSLDPIRNARTVDDEKTIESSALFVHCMKLLNIYCHVLSNQKPLCFIRPQVHQKNDLFTIVSAKELAIANRIGYFGNEYVYINLYNTVQTTYDVYKITINEQSGINFIELLTTTLDTLSLCIDFKENFLSSDPLDSTCSTSSSSSSSSPEIMKMMDEILQYLNILIDYAPIESIECLRQLQKFMFKRNLGSYLNGEYMKFMEVYRNGIEHNIHNEIFLNVRASLQKEFASIDEKFAKNIKLFEPMVVYCLTLFMKSNALVQSSILNLLCDLLDLNVTFSVLDSKSLIFEQILKNLELIEKCGIREESGRHLIPSIVRFLYKLTFQTDKKLMTIPKLLNIANNLLVNNSIKNANMLGIKTLSFEMFVDGGGAAAHAARPTVAVELNAQKEVLIGMLEKFIDSTDCQEVLTLLLMLFNFEYKEYGNRMTDKDVEQPTEITVLENATIFNIFSTALKGRKMEIQSVREAELIEIVYENTCREVLLKSDVFSTILATFIELDMNDYHNISYATIILKNILLETNEIYLVNHIRGTAAGSTTERRANADDDKNTTTTRTRTSRMEMRSSEVEKGHVNDDVGTSSLNEIKYFTQVLYEKLDGCLQFLVENGFNRENCGIVVKFIRALCAIQTNDDAFSSVATQLSSTLCEHHFMIKYYHIGEAEAEAKAKTNADAEQPQNQMEKYNIQIEIFKFLLLHRVDKSQLINVFVALLHPTVLSSSADVLESYSALFTQILEKYSNEKWSEEEAKLIFSRNLLNILINSNYSFVVDLCTKWKLADLFIRSLLNNLDVIDLKCVRPLLKLLQDTKELSIELKIEFLSKIYEQFEDRISYRKMIQHTILKVIHIANNMKEKKNEDDYFDDDDCDDEDDNVPSILLKLPFEIREELSKNKRENNEHNFENIFKLNIIDEKWLMNQIINFSSTSDFSQEEYVDILLQFKSETKLLKIFEQIPEINLLKLLKSAVHKSFENMITSFENDCIQHKPHINYMSLNPLAKLSLSTLITKINRLCSTTELESSSSDNGDCRAVYYLARTVVELFHTIQNMESMCLAYVDLRHVEKFVRENILKQEYLESFIEFVRLLCGKGSERKSLLDNQMYLECIDCILRENSIWMRFNEMENYEIVNFVFDEFRKLRLFNTMSCQRWIKEIRDIYDDDDDDGCKRNTKKQKQTDRNKLVDDDEKGNEERLKQKIRVGTYRKAIFIGKLIEAQIDMASEFECESLRRSDTFILLNTLKSIGISLLRTNELYSIAITPLEVLPRNQQYGVNLSESKMKTISVEQLLDLHVLHNFVQRLSMFGFSSRQQFEEHFMTFLLLINKDFDENNFDVQEEFIIKSTCLQIILELLLMYKTFPVVGNKLSRFKHSTRCQHLKFDTVGLKKLHQAQLLVCSSNVFNQPNLERDLSSRQNDNFIGTHNFWPNQYDLYYIWHQMEQSSQFQQNSVDGDGNGESTNSSRRKDSSNGVIETNFQYYSERSGIDFKSSTQVVFDVLSELLQTNPSLSLPVLVNFVEICECREHIEWIKDTIQRIQTTIPVDDTISHQYIIYLLCKTQAILIPTLSEVKQLCSQITFYLKSSHIFIRNATLCGLLSLLECCTKTNTTIGKLSEELTALRDVSTAYINFHISDSSIKCSSIHTRLVWTLNFCLIEWTSRFVPDCKLTSASIPTARDILRTTNDERLYLIVLHGYERLIISNIIDPGHFEKLSMELVKVENKRYAVPALKLLLSCMYMKSSSQLERTELSDGVIQDDPEIIVQITDKVDALLHCIKSSTKDVARLYGRILCQIIRDLVPPNEILTKVIKEFLSENQPYCDIIAKLIYTIFRLAIDSMYLEMLQEWLLCTIPTILAIPRDTNKCVWCLCVLFLSSSINSHLIKLLPILLDGDGDVDVDSKTTSANPTTTTKKRKTPKDNEISSSLFVTLAHDFYGKLNAEQKHQFRQSFEQSDILRKNPVFDLMLKSLH
ncbi:HTT family protein [Megaselia abdita]